MASDRDRRARSRSAHQPQAQALSSAAQPSARPLAVFTPRRRQASRPEPPSHAQRGGEGHAPAAYGARGRLVTPPREPLEPRTRKFLVRLANDTSNHLIRDSLEQDEPGSVLWKPFAVVRGVDVLRGVEREHAEASDAACLRGATDVSASIEEFALLFKLDSSGHGRFSGSGSGHSSGGGHSGAHGGSACAVNGHGLLFDADLQDMVTLYPIVLPSGDHPRRFVGIKWCLVGAPSRLFRRRDFCFLECQKEFTDSRGRRGWVRSMHSVKLPTVPSLESTHGIVRASLYRSGLTVVETSRPGVLRVTYTVEMDLKGRLPERLLPSLIAQRISRLADIDRFLQTQRLSSSPLLGDLDLADGFFLSGGKDPDAVTLAGGPSRHRRAACQLCYRPFRAGRLLGGARSKRFACRKCGESVCKNCSDDWLLDVPVIGQTLVRICTVCSAQAKHSHSVATADAHARQLQNAPATAEQDEARAFDRRTYRDQAQERAARRDDVSWGHERVSKRLPSGAGAGGRRDPTMRRRSVSMDDSSFDAMVDERSLYGGGRHHQNAAGNRSQQAVAPPEVRFDRAQIDRVQWHGPEQRQTLVDDDDDDDDDDSGMDDDSRDQFDDEPAGSRSVDRPSFMTEPSLSAEPEFFGAIAAPPGADVSSESSEDQEEELTIDGAGEIRGTADLTRWWTDETAGPKPRPMSGGGIVNGQRSPVMPGGNVLARRQERATWHNNNSAQPTLPAAPQTAAAPPTASRPQTVLSPVASRRASAAANNARRSQRPQSALAIMTPVRRDAAEQARMDLLSHYQRQSAVMQSTASAANGAVAAAGPRHPFQQQQQQQQQQQRPVATAYTAAMDLSQIEEPDDQVTVPPPPQHQERMSQLQRIRAHQQRQEVLRQRQLAYQRSQPPQGQGQPPTERPRQDASEREPRAAPSSMAVALEASTSSVATSSSLSSMGSASSGQSSGVERYALPPSSIIASEATAGSDVYDDLAPLASSSSTNSSDQTAGEVSEYVETSGGQWVTRGHAPAMLAPPPSAIKAASARRQAAKDEPGFCVSCGAPEYLGDRGNVLRSCECVAHPASSAKQPRRVYV